MAIRLSRALQEKRDIELGFGVVISFNRFGFADYKEAEAWAHRNARENLSGAQKASLAGQEVDELGAEFQDKLIGLAAEMLLDRLVMNFAKGWVGVIDDDDEILLLTSKNWEAFRDEFPVLVDVLDRRLQSPMHAIVTEGNVSAPLPNTDTPVV